MRLRLKYVLPLAQMALAVVLLRWSYLWMRGAIRIMDMPGPSPAFTLLMSINAPVAVVRATHYWLDSSYLWDCALTVVGIGALWYWVALNVDSWRERKMILQFKWAPLRIGTDLLSITLGALIGFLCAPFSYLPLPWLIPTWVSALMWGFGPMFLFGRDLVYCVRRTSPKIGN